MKPARPALALLVGVASLSMTPVGAAPRAALAAEAGSKVDQAVAAAKAAMMANPVAALGHARVALNHSRALSDPQARIGGELVSRWLEAEALTRINRPGQAQPIIEVALARAQQFRPRSKLHADLLRTRAGIAQVTGNVQRALLSLLAAHDIFRSLGEARSQAMTLQNIGSIYLEARDYRRALEYYDQAHDVYSDDPSLAVATHNNRAKALAELGRFDKAEKEYRAALAAARHLDSPLLGARIMTNIASAQRLAGKLGEADATARAGLRLAAGAAEGWQPYLWGIRAQVAFDRKDLATAQRFMARTFAGMNIDATTTHYREFHQTAYELYARTGNAHAALVHLKAFKRLDDEVREVAASTNAALMGARFDAANQKLRIAKLTAGQLQRDMLLAKERQRLRTTQLVGTLGAVMALIVLVAVWCAYVATRRSRDKVGAANEKLTYAARHDALTGLANRAYTRELISQALAESEITGYPCGLILIDLDRFKAVNDILGHQAGDMLLREVSSRLAAVAPAGAHVGRLGGDEFEIIVPGPADAALLDGLAAQVVACLTAPFTILGSQVTVGASVGVASSSRDCATVDALARCADLALYRSKENGRNQHSFFEPWMLEKANEQRQLESELHDAIEDDQLALVYQPIVDAVHGEIVAFEALLRWNHPRRGNLLPGEFIGVAEEAGLIHRVGEWVIQAACKEAATWPDHIKVAINVSAVQIELGGMAAVVERALEESGLAAERLEIEVLESVFLRDSEATTCTLNRMRAMGVSLVLDDFGTGYSSLSYLRRAQFNKIKIDRSFVKSAVGGCEESLAIIRAIVALARGLGMQTTAEGVEIEADRRLARQLGCSQLQGYLLGKPDACPMHHLAPQQQTMVA